MEISFTMSVPSVIDVGQALKSKISKANGPAFKFAPDVEALTISLLPTVGTANGGLPPKSISVVAFVQQTSEASVNKATNSSKEFATEGTASHATVISAGQIKIGGVRSGLHWPIAKDGRLSKEMKKRDLV